MTACSASKTQRNNLTNTQKPNHSTRAGKDTESRHDEQTQQLAQPAATATANDLLGAALLAERSHGLLALAYHVEAIGRAACDVLAAPIDPERPLRAVLALRLLTSMVRAGCVLPPALQRPAGLDRLVALARGGFVRPPGKGGLLWRHAAWGELAPPPRSLSPRAEALSLLAAVAAASQVCRAGLI